MASVLSVDRIRFLARRLRDRLWVKPLAICLVSVVAAIMARLADDTALAHIAPDIAGDSIETLLSTLAASMLVIATFSVASMVSAYASASSTVTPRAFAVVVADDASQNALSTFVGAFIYSVVALTALKNDYFGTAARFILFVLTVIVFAVVIVTFVRWVDSIARLGRMGSTMDKVEKATAEALERRRDAPTLGGVPVDDVETGRAVFAEDVGYVRHLDVAALQEWAETADARVRVAALPGAFAAPDRAVAYVDGGPGDTHEDFGRVRRAFDIGGDRLFDDDPRFGLVVLAEIAARALSPAVNDPGTAIQVLGALTRLFSLWSEPSPEREERAPRFDRVAVPKVSVRDMFDDAFTAIARDGAGVVEVGVRLQKTLKTLSTVGDMEMRIAAEHHARIALERARNALEVAEDLAAVRGAAEPDGPTARG